MSSWALSVATIDGSRIATTPSWALTIWHLPREKKSGFHDVFDVIAAHVRRGVRRAQMPFYRALYRRTMGIPRRSAAKLVRDLAVKSREKIGRWCEPGRGSLPEGRWRGELRHNRLVLRGRPDALGPYPVLDRSRSSVSRPFVPRLRAQISE